MKHNREYNHSKHRQHLVEEAQAANEVEERWRELRATFDRPTGFDLSFPGDQPRQILIATMMGRM